MAMTLHQKLNIYFFRSHCLSHNTFSKMITQDFQNSFHAKKLKAKNLKLVLLHIHTINFLKQNKKKKKRRIKERRQDNAGKRKEQISATSNNSTNVFKKKKKKRHNVNKITFFNCYKKGY